MKCTLWAYKPIDLEREIIITISMIYLALWLYIRLLMLLKSFLISKLNVPSFAQGIKVQGSKVYDIFLWGPGGGDNCK